MVCGHGTQPGQHCLGGKAWGLESPFYYGSWSMTEPTMCYSRWERAGNGTTFFIRGGFFLRYTCHLLSPTWFPDDPREGLQPSSSPVLEMRCWALGANVTPRLCLKPNPAGPQLPHSFISQQPLGGGKQHSLWTEGRIIFRNHVAKCWWNRRDPKKLKIHNRTELIGFTLTFITSTFEFSPDHFCAA